VKQRFYFCPKCGGELQYRDYEDIGRLTCMSCGYIFYENPVVGIAGILLNDKNEIFLGRRKNGVYAGKWCIPCGYVEYHEDIRDGLRREFMEETGLDIEITGIAAVQSNFHDSENHTVGIWFHVRSLKGHIRAGDDLDMLCFFNLHEIPEMAFPTDIEVIKMLRES